MSEEMISTEDKSDNDNGGAIQVGFVIGLIRGILAITLGIVLVFNPEKTRPFLFNTMGLFWLTSGVVLIRHTHPVFGRSEDGTLGKRMSILLGAIGILTGLVHSYRR